MAVAGHPDVVLVVVPPHPEDRAVVAALRVQGDDNAGLLGRRLVERDERRVPCIALPQNDVPSLLVREQELPLKTLLGTDEEVRAKALVI